MINKILIAIDRSSSNLAAFETGVFLAEVTGARLILLHILSTQEPNYPLAPIYNYHPIVDERNFEIYRQEIAEHERQALDFLKSLSDKATSAGVNTKFALLKGNPRHIICELANNWSADLIVVGSRELQGLKEIIFGSISNYITHHAPCSVIVARRSQKDRSIQISKLERSACSISLTSNQNYRNRKNDRQNLGSNR